MTIGKILSISTLSVLLAACGATGNSFSSLEAPAEGQSKLYVYRSPSFKGSAIHYDVYAGEHKIGNIRNGGYLSKELAPGEYEIWAKTEARRSVTIPLRANEIQCVKASVGFGAFVGRPKLESVSLDQCKAEITATKESLDI
ncbi:DUF2846 domain-containing protein [Neisseria sp. Dent CA1/247]|uniref:DUF2846 domain-containing protein n=1 Tax=Neisseria sp. Dent CA1/247 TaxID=2912675 RepID=UPI001FD5D4E9|nr:DUF2846 domain-containing protein [Neisseria sp. Dent CA1/247]UOO75863.1 DUF2846 domain-containing protein [Neisseria sp. Dent CA1/247]